MVKRTELKAGDWVEVRSVEEIARTLDERGEIAGMPFMPEMARFAGMRFRVYKRAHKTCDTVHPTRSRRVQNTVHLETRCDGQAHGGCQAQCLIFWKQDWLKPVGRQEAQPDVRVQPIDAKREIDVPLSRLRTSQVEPDGTVRYTCQATQLPFATQSLEWWDIRQYIEDCWSGNVGLGRIVRGFGYSLFYHLSNAGIGVGRPLRWIYDQIHLRWRGTYFPRKRGTIPEVESTPTASLNLQPGELVRVKSHAEILKTVNTLSMNRGMFWDAEMVPYCGRTFRVLQRVSKIINEKTGKMMNLKNPCLILDSVICQARYSHCRMFCPRAIYPFWREIWLERVDQQSAPETEPMAPIDEPLISQARNAQ